MSTIRFVKRTVFPTTTFMLQQGLLDKERKFLSLENLQEYATTPIQLVMTLKLIQD